MTLHVFIRVYVHRMKMMTQYVIVLKQVMLVKDVINVSREFSLLQKLIS